MTIEIAITLSGALFWIIIITNIASNSLGYQTFGDLDAEANLQKISDDPRKFKISFVIIFIEHVSIILLAITLFIAFNQLNLILALVWIVARSSEGLIQIFNKRNYWRLLHIARKYSDARDDEKHELEDLRMSILKSKQANFMIAQILFAIGTLAYSILFATHNVVPQTVGWLGIVASILYGTGNITSLIKPNLKALWSVSGLLILIFEILLGGWLLSVGMT